MTTKPYPKRTAAELIALYPPNEEPLPDAMIQEPYITDSLYLARDHLRERSDVLMSSNTFIYYEEGNRRACVAPDWYVVFGVDPAAIREVESYLLWEVGKPPDFVLEIASPSTWANDLGWKRDLYARIGVREYWRYDPRGGELYGEPLVGEELVDGSYRRLDMRRTEEGVAWGRSVVLGLDIHWGAVQVEFVDAATGEPLRRIHQERLAREAAEARADAEQARADAEQARADAEQARADAAEVELSRLRAQLRGPEP